MMKYPSYQHYKAHQRGWVMPSGMFRITVMAIIIFVVLAILIEGINANEKEKQQKLFSPRQIIYSLEMVWENDSIQIYEFHKGAYRSELFYDKINGNWFR